MKTKFNKSIYLAVAALLVSPLSVAVPHRISTRLIDLGEVHKIYLANGLASVVQLPYPITEAKVGNPDTILVQVSRTLPSEVSLILRKPTAQATNLIVRCGSRSFVFDLIPSKKTHQDLVRISGSYGAPEAEDIGAVLIDSSEKGAQGERGSKP